MNILVVPSWYKTEEDKTKGAFFFEQACALVTSGHKVSFADVLPVSPKVYFSKSVYRGIRHYVDQGVDIYELKTCSWGMSRFPNVYALMVKINLKRIIKRLDNIDLIQAHSYFPAGVVAVGIAKRKKIPSVVTEHYSNVVLGKFDGTIYERLFRKVYTTATQFTTVSQFFKSSIENKYGTRESLLITPNILNPLFKYAVPPHDETFHFIAIGHLVEGKHFEKIIRALSLVIFAGLKADLTVVGMGIQMEKLRNLAEENHVNDNIKFTGSIPRKQVVKHIQTSNCLVSASSFETFGVVYIESFACGRPVVTFANGGSNELVSESNGILIEGEQTVEKLADAMKKVIMDYDKYDTKKISDVTIERYSEKPISELYTGIYSAAINMMK